MKPLTITHEVLQLADALKAQLQLNEELQKQLHEAAEVINNLVDRCHSQQVEVEGLRNAANRRNVT